MLIQFSFKNYKSFRDEAILDLSATKITEFGERVVEIGKADCAEPIPNGFKLGDLELGTQRYNQRFLLQRYADVFLTFCRQARQVELFFAPIDHSLELPRRLGFRIQPFLRDTALVYGKTIIIGLASIFL